MKPGRVSLTIYQGGTFRQRFVWKTPNDQGVLEPRDLTGYAARSQIRINGRDVLTFDSADDSVTLTADGVIELLASADDVSAAATGSGSWSLEVDVPGGDRIVLLAGPVTLMQETTR